MEKIESRNQFDERFPIPEVHFPASIVQPNQCPSISQMVKTRSVGGSLEEYEQDGIESDAPFDSEYLDFFDLADIADSQKSEGKDGPAVERKTAEDPPSNDRAPQNTDIQSDSGKSSE